VKKLLLLILISLIITSAYSSSFLANTTPHKAANYGGVKDGWYSAKVKYTNYSTGTNSTYSLDVKVEYGNVSKIDFGNGGSVRSCYNNEGYLYSEAI